MGGEREVRPVDALAADVARVAVNLKRLAVPGGRLDHHFLDMLVVLRALAERGIQQPSEGEGEDHPGEPDFGGFVTHK